MNWGTLIQNAKENGFASTLLPEGDYVVDVESTTVRTSKAGAPQILVTYKVVDGPYAGEEAADFLTFSEKAGGMAMQKIESIGGDEAFFAKLVSSYGTELNEHALKEVARLFDGKKLLVSAKVTKDGKNNNFNVSQVLIESSPGAVVPAVAASIVSVPSVNPYAAPPVAAVGNLPV